MQGLGIVRIFGKHGIPAILLDDTRLNIARHSDYCRAFFKYNTSGLYEFLKAFKARQEYQHWLVFPTNDAQVKLLSQNKTGLEDFYTLSIDTWEVIEKCYNKVHTYKLAEELKIPKPGSWFPASEEDLKAIRIEYPCIIKPAVMHDFYRHFKTKVFICNHYNELVKNYRKARSFIPADEIIVQEIIPGDSSNQYSACFLFNGQEAIVQMVARRLRQHPVDFGNATTYAETVQENSIIERGTKFLRAINFKGICEVEFKRDPRDGDYKLLEINARTWKWHYIALAANSPFLMAAYSYFMEGTVDGKYLSWGDACWQHKLTDGIIRRKLNKSDPARTELPCNNKVYAVFDREDRKPFIFEKLYLPYLLFSR